MVSGPLSTLKNTLLSDAIVTVMILASGVFFSDTENGTSTLAGSAGLIVAVNIKNVSSNENRSTIGVMSTWGDLCGILIFGMR
jgi:hypothetical protein